MANRHINANHVLMLLIDDSGQSNRAFSGLAVTDNQFPLAPAYRDHPSIAFIPVCNGTDTDCRAITPGAIISKGLYFSG